MANIYAMNPKTAKEVLQKILDDPHEVRCKTVMQMEALNIGANMIERANENGANLHHEFCILRYHATNKEAIIFREERLLGAIKEAIKQINLDIIRHGGRCE